MSLERGERLAVGRKGTTGVGAGRERLNMCVEVDSARAGDLRGDERYWRTKGWRNCNVCRPSRLSTRGP